MSSTPNEVTKGRKGLSGLLLRPTRVPATVQAIIMVLLVYVLATSHLTFRDLLLVIAGVILVGLVSARLVIGMRRRYGQQDQEEESRDMAAAEQSPFFGRAAWHVLGSQRVPLVYLVFIYASVVYCAISIKYPWLP